MIRLFVAVDLHPEALDELRRFIDRLSSKRWPVRWESPPKLHITLFFLGWVADEAERVAVRAVEKGIAGIVPFSIRMGKLGVFPDFVQPRVVWVGVKGDQPMLVRLRKQVVEQLMESGFVAERRQWLPHLTIGRVEKEARFRAKKELGRQLKKLEIDEFRSVSRIDQVVVYRSVLKPTGSTYLRLHTIALA